MRPEFDYIKCPLNRYTFKIKPIRAWVETQCDRYTLNLFAGQTILNIDEIRNDKDPGAPADYHLDAIVFIEYWFRSKGAKFDTILLDPPYSYRKSMELYNGIKCSRFRRLKDSLINILEPNGKVITFGYHSNSMGKARGFDLERIALFSHGGAIHDTVACVERYHL